jgi:hypothetical protein
MMVSAKTILCSARVVLMRSRRHSNNEVLGSKSQVDGWDYFETYRFGKTANITVGP